MPQLMCGKLAFFTPSYAKQTAMMGERYFELHS
jgi:hypothetical protein